MEKSSSLMLLQKIQTGPLPMRILDGSDVPLILMYKSLNFIKVAIGPISKGKDTYGQRGEILVTCVTAKGLRVLGYRTT